MASWTPLPRFHFVDENDPEKEHKSRAHIAKELHRLKRRRWKLVHATPNSISDAYPRIDQLTWPLEDAINAASSTVNIPSALSASDKLFLHHYTVVIPELYKARWKLVGQVPAVAVAPLVDLFQLYCRDEVSFQAILFDAATHCAALQGKPPPLELENRLLRTIAANLHSLNPGIILATALLCNIKCMEGTGSSAHWLALKEMITIQGGFTAFKNDDLLFTKLVWSFIALPGPLTGFEFAPDQKRGLRDLGDLLRARQKAIVNLLPTSEEEMDRLADSARIRAFKSSKLRDLLLPSSSKHPTERNSRVAVVLFLASALMLHGDFDSRTDFFIETIDRHLREVNDEAVLSPPHLLWFVARLSCQKAFVDSHSQLWNGVIRMTTAFHRLRMTTQEKVEALLFTSIEIPETIKQLSDQLRWAQDLEIEEDHNYQPLTDRSVPVECFCEILWFTEPPNQ